MGTAANAQIQYESAQNLKAFAALVDSGDHIVFTPIFDIMSGRSGYEPDIRPDGIISGIDILSAGSGNNEVDNIAFTAWLAGALKEVSATTVSVTRASSQTHVINSIILTGTTLSAVKGSESTGFSTTRGAAGGPPYIAVGSIEVGQIKTTSQTPAALTSSEIFQTPGTHQERADYPLYRRPQNLGYGVLASSTSRTNAHIEFYSALSLCHTGDLCRGVYLKYYTPTFTAIESNGFTPADKQSSQSYAQRYDKMLGYKTDNLRSAAFRAELTDGVSDALIALDGEMLIFKTFPDSSSSPFMLTMGILRFDSSFPQTGPISTGCTVIAKLPTARFSS